MRRLLLVCFPALCLLAAGCREERLGLEAVGVLNGDSVHIEYHYSPRLFSLREGPRVLLWLPHEAKVALHDDSSYVLLPESLFLEEMRLIRRYERLKAKRLVEGFAEALPDSGLREAYQAHLAPERAMLEASERGYWNEPRLRKSPASEAKGLWQVRDASDSTVAIVQVQGNAPEYLPEVSLLARWHAIHRESRPLLLPGREILQLLHHPLLSELLREGLMKRIEAVGATGREWPGKDSLAGSQAALLVVQKETTPTLPDTAALLRKSLAEYYTHPGLLEFDSVLLDSLRQHL